jgi:Uma2 family endonuclease
MLCSMRAVVQEVPESWLEERARLGLDHHDEIWEGVLHMPPAPGFAHQRLGSRLLGFLEPRLARSGILVMYQTEVHEAGSGGKNYRIPDMVFFRDEAGLVTMRGLEGAPLAVLEIRSPDDETYEKFAFWARLGVAEVIVLVPDTRAAEVYRLAGDRYVATSADVTGAVHAASIDVRFTTLQGDPPKLRVEHGGAAIEI